jgi:hypothetical protein
MKKESKATRIRKLLLADTKPSTIAKLVKCNSSYVYMIKKAMDEVTNVLEANKGKPRISLTVKETKIAKKLGVPLDVYAREKLKLDRRKNAAKDTGVPPRKNAHRVRVIQTKRLRMMADAQRKEADALDHWENAVAPKSILDEAQGIIWGDREKTYGEPDVNLKRIATLWNAFLVSRYKHGYTGEPYEITSEDVCWMMVMLKASRQMNAPKRDNLVDAAGYIGLIERIQK